MHPAQFGPYTIVSRLGRGGMGTVYEAVDTATRDVVAVKTLAAHLGDNPVVRRRFAAEIEALKALRHPGIVRLIAFGEEEGQPYFAMELVRGHSLEHLLREGRQFDWRETIETAIEVTRALKAAHDHGVIHRDLKPSNLLFPDDPDANGRVKLADFGIARLFGDPGQTFTGTVIGTAEYMAPEQAAGRPVDQRADLYALGMVMFAMLAGRPPFRGRRVAEVLERQRKELPPRVSQFASYVPPELDSLIARLLAKDPSQRPASALALGRLLAAIGTPAGPRVDAAAAGSPVDLLAPTRGLSVAAGEPTLEPTATERQVSPGAVTRDAAPTAPANAAAVTTPDPQRAPPGRLPRGRFTTVEELDRAQRIESEAARRREIRLRAVLACGLLATVAVAAAVLLREPSADELLARIREIAHAPDGDPRDARPSIDRFLGSHPDDPRAGEVRDLARRLDLDALERRSRRRPPRHAALGAIERDYRAAMEREAESPLACLAALEGIAAVHAQPTADDGADGDLWLALVKRQIDRLTPLAREERLQDVERAAAALAQARLLDAEAATATNPDARDELVARRRDILAGLVEIYGPKPHMAEQVATARRLLEDRR